MPRLSPRLRSWRVKCNAVFTIYSGALVAGITSHLLGAEAVALVADLVLFSMMPVCLFCIAKLFREIGRELGVVCFENGRCVALDDIALIYIESEGKPQQ